MNLKLTNLKTNFVKAGVIAVILMVTALACLGIGSIQKANANDGDLGASGSLIVSHGLDEFSPALSLQYTADWYPAASHPGYQIDEWTNGMDVLGQYDTDGNTTEVHYRCGFSYTSSLYITLYDANNDLYKDFIFHVADTNAFSWYLNGEEVTTAEKKITDLSTPITFNCDKVPDFEIYGTVYDQDTKNPIEGAWVQFYDINKTPVIGASDITDENGEYYIEEISTSDLPGFIVVSYPKYKDDKYAIEFTGADFEREIEWDFNLKPEASEAEVYIAGGEHHVHFELILTRSKGGEVIVDTEVVDVIEGETIPAGLNYVINENGSMVIDSPANDGLANIEIKPVGEENYIVDKWSINGEDLEVGKTYTTGEEDINGLVTYKLPSVAEEVTAPQASSQTGDAIPFVICALSLIALIAGGAVLRKSFK